MPVINKKKQLDLIDFFRKVTRKEMKKTIGNVTEEEKNKYLKQLIEKLWSIGNANPK